MKESKSMIKSEHYPHRTVTLRPGDTIWVTYLKPKNNPFSATTLKRLFGWINEQRYIGRVREEAPRRGVCPDERLVVDFYKADERGKFQCTHVAYNIELMIVKGELRDLHYKPNPSPSLFDL